MTSCTALHPITALHFADSIQTRGVDIGTPGVVLI